jgi:hypothetical protein
MNARTLLVALALPIGLALLAYAHPGLFDSMSGVISQPLHRLNTG